MQEGVASLISGYKSQAKEINKGMFKFMITT
jgi:hypothetical protein